ncbi:MAG: hypothetical protein ACREGL_00555 [Alphaproteobacteria bacterium]
MGSHRIVALAAAVTLAACAQTYHPIVDMKDVDQGKYQTDLADCRQYAEQVSPAEDALAGTLIGAVIGTAMFAALGAVTGDAGTGAAVGAALGGTTGAAAGAGGGIERQIQVIKTCLGGRGYKVLG